MLPVQTRRIVRIPDGLWGAASAPQTSILLAVLLSATLALAALLPQQPSGLGEDAAESWLAAAASAYGAAGTLLRGLGAFHLLSSSWLRALLAASALHLILRLAAQISFFRDSGRSRIPGIPPTQPIHRARLAIAPEAAVALARQSLDGIYHAVRVEEDATRTLLYAERNRLGELGPVGIYAGLLLLLAGLALNDAVGWRTGDLTLAPGDAAAVAHPGGIEVALDAVEGGEQDSFSSVTITAPGRSRKLQVGLDRPGRLGNVWLTQKTTGPSLEVTAQEAGGPPVVMQLIEPGGEVGSSLHLLFRQTESEQAFTIPTRNLAFRVVSYAALPERGISRPVFLVEGYLDEAAAPVATALIEENGSLIIEGVLLRMQRGRHAILEIAYLPGLIFLVLGALASLAGSITAAIWPPSRTWVGLAATEDAVAAAVCTLGRIAPKSPISAVFGAAGAGGVDAV